MIKNKKRIIAMLSIFTLTTIMFSGCNKTPEQQTQQVYELTALDSSQLQEGKLYVKDGDSFYECPTGTVLTKDQYPRYKDLNYFSETNTMFKAIMFGQDDALIPTLYKDQQLIYVTSVTPQEFHWDRYMDDGYTFGAIGLYGNVTNKCTLTLSGDVLLDGSSIRTSLVDAGLGADDEIVINKIQDTSINASNLSTCGSIKGIEKDKAYKLEVYKGSDFYPLTDVIADTHVFHTFESFQTIDYDYIQTDYVSITIPSDYQSGYYNVNDLGLFRYVNGSATDGNNNINFNDAYWIYLNETNEHIKYTDLKENNNSSTPEEKENEIDYVNKTVIDCSNQAAIFTITYKDAMTQTLDGETNAINDEVVGYPSATLVSPDGKEYSFTIDTTNKTLTCQIQHPMSGEWTTNIINMSQRKFDINTAFTSGHSDSLIHAGSGMQKMTYYLTKHMNNAAFAVTWENASRRATVEIIAPDGTKYSKEIDPSLVYNENYGYIVFVLGELNAGDYTITISGEDDLGRVRVQTQDVVEGGSPSFDFNKK